MPLLPWYFHFERLTESYIQTYKITEVEYRQSQVGHVVPGSSAS